MMICTPALMCTQAWWDMTQVTSDCRLLPAYCAHTDELGGISKEPWHLTHFKWSPYDMVQISSQDTC